MFLFDSKILRTCVFIYIACLPTSLWGSYAEFFGASPRSSAIGSQFTGDTSDAANNYYSPAALAFSNKIDVDLASGLVMPSFKDINSVIIRNDVNELQFSAGGPVEIGPVDTDYQQLLMGMLHLAIPLKEWGRIGASVFAPMGHILESNTGDTFLPEYVMYRARYNRNLVHINYAHKISSQFAFSFGFHMGMQAGSNLNARAVPNGTPTGGTTSDIRVKARPSLVGILSAAYRWDPKKNSLTTLTFQQQSKSRFVADTSGAASNPVLPFVLEISSMIYYDPHIFRLSHSHAFDRIQLFGTLEYQVWSGYQTPVTRVKKIDGVLLGSPDYEQTTAKNILIPKFGVKWQAFEKLAFNLGLAYRPTPLKGDFSGAGNSIDTDSYIGSTGLVLDTSIFGMPIKSSLSLQYHQLKSKFVTKAPGREDGSTAQNKIGAPGYLIGGKIITAGLGLSLSI